jgi:ATP/ADP translocase
VVLPRLIDLRRGERRKTILMAASIMTIVAAYMMVKAVRDAVFLAKFSLEAKALVSIGLALCAGLGTALITRLCHGRTRLRVIFLTNVAVAVSLIALWLALVVHMPGSAAALYIWSSFFGLVIIANFWLLANELYDARAAKRLFALLGAGAIVGGIVGGLVTHALAEVIGAINLLPVIGGGLLVSAFLAWGAASGAGLAPSAAGAGGERPPPFAEGFRLLRRHHYLRLVAVLLLLSTLATTLIDYQIQGVVRAHFGADRDAMAAFFGWITSLLSAASLVVQLLVTARFIKRFGVTPALFVLPLTIFLGAGAIALHAALAIPALFVATTAKIGDGGVRFSLDKAAMELLYMPVPSQVKGQAKPVIDTFVDRLGTAVTGVVWIVVSAASAAAGSSAVTVAAFVTIGIVAAWGLVIVITRRHHLRVLREALPSPVATTAAALAGEDQRGLHIAIDHPAPRVRAWALDVLAAAGDTTFMLKAQRALRDPDPAVRAAARRYLGRTDGDLDETRGGETDLSQAVDTRAAAAALLATLPGRSPGARTKAVRALWRIHRRGGVTFTPAAIEPFAEQELASYRAHATALAILDRGPRRARRPSLRLLLRTLDRSLAGDRERLFRLLGLCYPERDVLAAYRGLREGDRVVRAHAVELLDNLLDQPLRRQVIEALEEKYGAAETRVDPAAAARAALRELAEDADWWVRSCTDYILDEEGLEEEGEEEEGKAHADDDRTDAAAARHPVAPRSSD